MLEEREIISCLNEEDERTDDGSGSEMKNHVSDNVQSDTNDEYIDEVIDETWMTTENP